jgi:DNA-directed RNA polymerase subunit K/omega
MEFIIQEEDKNVDTYNTLFNNDELPKRMSKNILTKYEKTQLIGVRTEQLAYGAPTTLTTEDEESCTNVKEIAELEFQKKIIPLIICRHLPNKIKEYWRLDELIVV